MVPCQSGAGWASPGMAVVRCFEGGCVGDREREKEEAEKFADLPKESELGGSPVCSGLSKAG